jgi:hypothetical protein
MKVFRPQLRPTKKELCRCSKLCHARGQKWSVRRAEANGSGEQHPAVSWLECFASRALEARQVAALCSIS